MLGIRWKWVVSPGNFPYLDRATSSHLREDWVSPRASLNAAVKRKYPCLIVRYVYLLCLIVLPLPLDENPSTVQLNNNNDNINNNFQELNVI
jgi:hypothetical protein